MDSLKKLFFLQLEKNKVSDYKKYIHKKSKIFEQFSQNLTLMLHQTLKRITTPTTANNESKLVLTNCKSKISTPVANIKLNNLFFAQAKIILFHYIVNFQGINTDLCLLEHINNVTQATIT